MGPKGFAETSETNCHFRNIPDEQRPNEKLIKKNDQKLTHRI
jgi:hypothetical protein